MNVLTAWYYILAHASMWQKPEDRIFINIWVTDTTPVIPHAKYQANPCTLCPISQRKKIRVVELGLNERDLVALQGFAATQDSLTYQYIPS